MEENFLPSAPKLRLAKLIAQRGIASRRKAEELISEGSVTVNGVVVSELGFSVDPKEDHVRINGKALPGEPEKKYFVLYKPKGMITVADDKGRTNVAQLLADMNLKVEPVGRLDYNTEGALLLTNDGEMANRLNRPETKVPKRYLAKCYRTPSDGDLLAIERGVTFPDGRSKPAKARVLEQTDKDNAWVEITITESGPRVVQRILTQLGHPVSKLRRESFATISIRGMERGQVRELTPMEIQRLRDIAEGTAPKKAGKNWKGKGFAKAKPKPKRSGMITSKKPTARDAKPRTRPSKGGK